jgi:hypothetical protein
VEERLWPNARTLGQPLLGYSKIAQRRRRVRRRNMPLNVVPMFALQPFFYISREHTHSTFLFSEKFYTS